MEINRGMWLAAAATLALAGCGATTGTGDGGTGGGDGGSTSGCTDTSCGTGKACHPVLKQCVSSCTAAADCPASQKTCDVLGGSTAKFCQCATDQLCAAATAGNICSNATRQCTAKCTINYNCPTGYDTCSTSTGQCLATVTPDAGMTMDAGVACNSSNTQPDICGHTNVCGSDMKCAAVTDGTCGNIANGKSAPNSTTPRTPFTSASTGAVIYDIVDEATNDDAACLAGTNAFTFTVYAYPAANTTFGPSLSDLPAFYYYTSSGDAKDAKLNTRPSNYKQLASGSAMSAKVTLCPANTTTLEIGMGFSNGNGVCATITR